MHMKSRWVLATLAVACIAVWNACTTAKNSSSSTTAFFWVATAGDQMVRSYNLNLTSGAISQTGTAVATGAQPEAMAITPDGKSLFITNSSDSSISAYSVNSDGSLSAKGTTPSSGQLPVALATDPSGKFLFVVDQQSGDISSYTISATSLTAVGATPTQTSSSFPSSPSGLAVSPSGNFVYVANNATNTVLGFSYDSNGVLTPLPSVNPNPCGTAAPGYCVQVAANPSGVAFSRCAGITTATAVCATADDNNLFVSNSGSNNISVFSACIQTSPTCASPDGTLTQISPSSPVAACCGPTTFMVDPAADFVYVLERSAAQVGQFAYSPVAGALTALSPAADSTGASPFSGAITANISNSNWVLVTNAGASSVSVFRVSGAGRLSALSTGPFAVNGQPTAILAR